LHESGTKKKKEAALAKGGTTAAASEVSQTSDMGITPSGYKVTHKMGIAGISSEPSYILSR
jgi:hypothetical protein